MFINFNFESECSLPQFLDLKSIQCLVVVGSKEDVELKYTLLNTKTVFLFIRFQLDEQKCWLIDSLRQLPQINPKWKKF